MNGRLNKLMEKEIAFQQTLSMVSSSLNENEGMLLVIALHPLSPPPPSTSH